MSRRNAHPPIDRDAAGDALLADPALAEALADPAGFERLSDADVRAMRVRRRQALGATTAAALALVIGIGGWWGLRPAPAVDRTEHYATARGHRAEVQLADGSTLTLDGETSIDVTFATDRRAVVMRSGEAYFDIVHDPARPFTVQAGTSSTRVLGTAFDLNLMHGRAELAVYRGAVRFGAANAGAQGAVVRAGYRSRFADGAASEPSRFDVNRQDWREGWLDADDMPLGEVVEAINRQGGTVILPPSEPLARVRIAGRFKLDDPAALLDAIGSAYGFRVRAEGQALRLEPVTPS
jgi:transmembrane sensor